MEDTFHILYVLKRCHHLVIREVIALLIIVYFFRLKSSNITEKMDYICCLIDIPGFTGSYREIILQILIL